MHSGGGDSTLLLPGFPIRTPSDHSSVDSSPRLIAASHVLHRLLVPRHPPCALNNLTTKRCSRPLCKSQTTNSTNPTTATKPHHTRNNHKQPCDKRYDSRAGLHHPRQPTPPNPPPTPPTTQTCGEHEQGTRGTRVPSGPNSALTTHPHPATRPPSTPPPHPNQGTRRQTPPTQGKTNRQYRQPATNTGTGPLVNVPPMSSRRDTNSPDTASLDPRPRTHTGTRQQAPPDHHNGSPAKPLEVDSAP